MQTLIKSKEKLKIATLEDSPYKFTEKVNHSKFNLDFKFYQKLLAILFTSCVFLIFPESPQDLDVLCRKYHSNEVCIVW